MLLHIFGFFINIRNLTLHSLPLYIVHANISFLAAITDTMRRYLAIRHYFITSDICQHIETASQKINLKCMYSGWFIFNCNKEQQFYCCRIAFPHNHRLNWDVISRVELFCALLTSVRVLCCQPSCDNCFPVSRLYSALKPLGFYFSTGNKRQWIPLI